MIVRERPSYLELFFTLKGSVIRRVWPQCLFVMVLSAAVVGGHAWRPGLVPTLDGTPFSLVGIALSVFLAFRNSACYDRWWEARKQWGAMVAAVRDLARQSLVLEARGEAGPALRRDLIEAVIAYVRELVDLLRGVAPAGRWRFPADARLREAGTRLAAARTGGLVSDIEFSMLDGSLKELCHAAAACERIRTTPVPFGYTLLLHRTAHIFCFLLPFGFADVIGWGTPIVAGLVAYTFFGLDALGDEMEEPFSLHSSAVPIGAIAGMIEINLREALGETDLPDLPRPVDGVLL
ncbi:bestrophin family protein [Ancylobacter amanitiformis]|uniref:Membrane protein n=1 Tax=Ancylobacter amanitiformis TaxID=217069 RepID=A0ABU0LPE1_9HYPH|nr:bestrophin family protein [Ancylobacter amanitiformis]MDQ0510576.1 putative membrane protein [Ancylobacter amanitiformis]